VLRRYSSNFPQYAFDQDAWLWPFWQKWRARYARTDRRLLSALAQGIHGRGSGWKSRAASRAWTLAQAKNRLTDWSSDAQLKRLYDAYAESARSRNDDVRRTGEQQQLPDLVAAIQRRTGYITSSAELQQGKLSGVLRLAVSRAFGVRERDLH
jgi:hypothetical protein